ncbi:MAG: hypothetical protein Q6363_007015 [Candidatus Njordarchaeota archaeon]
MLFFLQYINKKEITLLSHCHLQNKIDFSATLEAFEVFKIFKVYLVLWIKMIDGNNVPKTVIRLLKSDEEAREIKKIRRLEIHKMPATPSKTCA